MKKIISIILAISIAICSVSFSFAETTAYNMSFARLEAAYDYLNEMYLDTNLGMYIEYASQKDIETLQKLADSITKNCTTDKEKCIAIYNWVRENVKVSLGSKTSYAPIDVFRNLVGICSGHAQLMSALMKLSGVKAAICRGYLIDTNTTTLSTIYDGVPEGHQWVMAYYNNDWHVFDDLWGECGNNNREDIASKYYLVHVDGISAYTEAMDLTKDEFGRASNTIYKDGEFLGVKNGTTTNEASANLSLGGCIRYSKMYYWAGGWEAYYAPLEGQVNNTVGTAVKGGYYTYFNKAIFFVKENGITLGNSVVNYNNDLLLVNGAGSIKINDSIDNNGFTEGKLNMYVGETIDLTELYTGNVVLISLNKNVATTAGLKIGAIKDGSATVRICDGNCKISLEINVYGDIINSKDTFKTFCDHEECHEVYGKDYCDYCGAEIKEEVVETPVVESVVEEPIVNKSEVQVVSEPAIEPQVATQEAIQEPVVNEPVVETPVVNEPVVKESKPEEPIVETPAISEEVEQVNDTPVKQEQIATEPAIEASIVDTPVATPTELVEEEPKTIATNEVGEQVNETIKEEETALVDETKEEVTPTVITINITLPEKVNNNQTLKDNVITLISSIITLILQFANEIA